MIVILGQLSCERWRSQVLDAPPSTPQAGRRLVHTHTRTRARMHACTCTHETLPILRLKLPWPHVHDNSVPPISLPNRTITGDYRAPVLHSKEVLGDADWAHQGGECDPLVPENWPFAAVLLYGQEDQNMGRVWTQAIFLLPAHLHGARTICQVRFEMTDTSTSLHDAVVCDGGICLLCLGWSVVLYLNA